MESTTFDQRARLWQALRAEGIASERVLRAMAGIPRHELVPAAAFAYAYENRPLDIGHQQTISQPLIVALMTELARVEPGSRVLEIGTGSGYQTAVLAALGAEVFTIEIIEELADSARVALEQLGYAARAHFRIGDGFGGWAGAAPFDAILVTAAPPAIPEALKVQLAVGGRLVIPVGESQQELCLVERTHVGFEERKVTPVRFVPMTGAAARRAAF